MSNLIKYNNPPALAIFAQKIDTEPAFLELILRAQSKSIRAALRQDEQNTRAALGKMIFGLAEVYTSAVLTDSNGITETARFVVAECLNILVNKFASLSPDEVREAFRQAAAGQTSAKLAAYNGKFTPVMFGDVLRAYKAERERVLAKYENQAALLESRKPDAGAAAKNAEALQAAVDWFNDAKQRAAAGEIIKAAAVPANLGRILCKNGVICHDTAKKVKLYDQAKKTALMELKNEIIGNNHTAGQKQSLKRQLLDVLHIIQAGGDEASLANFKARADAIYSRLVVIEALNI